MQETRVQSLIREGLACRGATKPQPLSLRSLRAWELQVLSPGAALLKPVRPEPMLRNKRDHRSEKPMQSKEREQLLLATTREKPSQQQRLSRAKDK